MVDPFSKLNPTKNHVYVSLNFSEDCGRAAKIYEVLGDITPNIPIPEEDWDDLLLKGEAVIKSWINERLRTRTCTIVLVGTSTSMKEWVRYEIIKSWDLKKGVLGIFVDGIQDEYGNESIKGNNPFADVTVNDKSLSEIASCVTPAGNTSEERVAWIKDNIQNLVDKAIEIRNNN